MYIARYELEQSSQSSTLVYALKDESSDDDSLAGYLDGEQTISFVDDVSISDSIPMYDDDTFLNRDSSSSLHASESISELLVDYRKGLQLAGIKRKSPRKPTFIDSPSKIDSPSLLINKATMKNSSSQTPNEEYSTLDTVCVLMGKWKLVLGRDTAPVFTNTFSGVLTSTVPRHDLQEYQLSIIEQLMDLTLNIPNELRERTNSLAIEQCLQHVRKLKQQVDSCDQTAFHAGLPSPLWDRK